MTIKIGKWLIEPYKKSRGYVIKRKVGADRWKARSYFFDLPGAVTAVFEERFRTETDNLTLDACDVASARQCTTQIVNAIERGMVELREACRDAE